MLCINTQTCIDFLKVIVMFLWTPGSKETFSTVVRQTSSQRSQREIFMPVIVPEVVVVVIIVVVVVVVVVAAVVVEWW